MPVVLRVFKKLPKHEKFKVNDDLQKCWVPTNLVPDIGVSSTQHCCKSRKMLLLAFSLSWYVYIMQGFLTMRVCDFWWNNTAWSPQVLQRMPPKTFVETGVKVLFHAHISERCRNLGSPILGLYWSGQSRGYGNLELTEMHPERASYCSKRKGKCLAEMTKYAWHKSLTNYERKKSKRMQIGLPQSFPSWPYSSELVC